MAELRKAIDEEDAKEFVPARNKALAEALATIMDVEVPDTLVTNQAREKFAVMMAEMRDGGVADEEIKRQINPENFLKYKDIVKDDIIRDFKVSMATDEIARLEGLTVPDYQVEEQLEAVKKEAAQSSEDFDEAMIRGKVEATMMRQGVMDWLAGHSKMEVEYVDEEFDEELMQKLADESMEREKKLAEEKAKEAESGKTAVAEAAPEPVVEKKPVSSPAVAKDVSDKAEDYANLSLEERAFQILADTGAVDLHKSPDDPDYDHSADDEKAPENKFV